MGYYKLQSRIATVFRVLDAGCAHCRPPNIASVTQASYATLLASAAEERRTKQLTHFSTDGCIIALINH